MEQEERPDPRAAVERGPSSLIGVDVRARLGWEVTPELYRRIRRLWIRHSLAEDRRDIPGLLATLAENCVYELVPTGQRWVGHEGARQFYHTLLGAFPDVKFALQDIVIGPQGVIEVARLTGTHQGPWAGLAPTGRRVDCTVIIYFPWDPNVGKFAGEKVYFDRAVLEEQLGPA